MAAVVMMVVAGGGIAGGLEATGGVGGMTAISFGNADCTAAETEGVPFAPAEGRAIGRGTAAARSGVRLATGFLARLRWDLLLFVALLLACDLCLA